MKKIIKLFLLPFTGILYFISGLFKRDANVWVFGSQKQMFIDNTKHMFIDIVMNYPEIKAIWITGSKENVKYINDRGGIAYLRWSLKGFFWSCKAKYWFVTTTSGEINYYYSKNAVIVNLWHGVAIKKIYFDTDNPDDLKKRFTDISFFQKYVYEPFTYKLSDFAISTSDQVSRDSLSSGLRVSIDRCLPLGQARTDIFSYSEEARNVWLAKWGTSSLKKLIEVSLASDYVWIYMPTWRDNAPNFIENIGLNLTLMNDILLRKKSILVLKLHPNTPSTILDTCKDFSNIIVAESEEDLYAYLPYTDALITDYSSIYIDYLLLNKPIYFFCYDLEDYISNARGLYYKYDDVTPGLKVKNVSQLYKLLENGSDKDDTWSKEREKIKTFFFKHDSGGSVSRLINYLKANSK